MFPADIYDLARKTVEALKGKSLRVVLAESCTGGLIAGALTEIPGASVVIERGFVSYSNDAKHEVLGVPPETLRDYGAVSTQTVEAMAKGALDFSYAEISLAVTGIAGPDGGTPEKPVGLVHFGVATRDGALLHYTCNFRGDRTNIRMEAVREGLRLLSAQAED